MTQYSDIVNSMMHMAEEPMGLEPKNLESDVILRDVDIRRHE